MKKKNPGKAAKHEFYRVLGAALAQWYGVEMWLFKIFDRMTGAPTPNNSAIFYAVINAKTRLEMMNELSLVVLRHEPTLSKEWVKLSEKVRDKSKKRNHIAHYMPHVDLRVPDISKVWRLEPHQHDITSRAKKNPQIYDTHRIEETGAEFKMLAKSLETFFAKIPSP